MVEPTERTLRSASINVLTKGKDQLLQEIEKEPNCVVTHSGCFHCDEVFATALL